MSEIILNGQKLSVTEAQRLLSKLKKEYERNMDKDSFNFEGQEIVTGYAKYVIEYLENSLK